MEDDEQKEQGEVEAKPAVPEYTAETGIIIPPTEIKLVAERTADFVRRVGTQFEAEIMQRNAKNKKFSFLQPASPYYAYYQQLLKQGSEGVAQAVANGTLNIESTATIAEKAQEAAEKPKAAKKKKKVLTLNERLQDYINTAKVVPQPEEAEGAAEPQPFAMPVDKFSIKVPDMFAPVDIEIIKLTAQFVSRNGRNFLAGLSQREQRNPQFDFLKPTHPLFSFFQQLIEAYAQSIVAPQKVIKELRDYVAAPATFLHEALQIAKHKEKQLELERQKDADTEQERIAMQLIDWHAFVVVETITFNKDEEDLLPEPKETIEEINRMLEQQTLAEKPAEEDMGDEDMDMDMGDDAEDGSDDERTTAPSAAAVRPPSPEPEPEILKNVAELNRRQQNVDRSVKFQKCPICGEEISVEDLQEHMRIELLDPKWKENKTRLQEKQRETSLAHNRNIAANLKALSSHMPDVFETKQSEEFESEAMPMSQWDNQPVAKPAAPAAAAVPAVRPTLVPPPVQAPVPQRAPVPMPAPAAGGALLMNPARAAMIAGQAPPGARPPMQLPPQQGQPPQQQPLMQQPPQMGAPGAAPGGALLQTQQQQQAARLAAIARAQPTPVVPPAQVMPGMPGAPVPQMYPGMPMGMPPQQPGMGAPMTAFQRIAMQQQAPPLEDPAAKRAKIAAPGATGEAALVDESEWLKQHSGPLRIIVAVPAEVAEVPGGVVEVTLDATQTVSDLKDKVSSSLSDFPANKMKLNIVGGMFLNKDAWTLAHYNLRSGINLQLGLRERGGKKR